MLKKMILSAKKINAPLNRLLIAGSFVVLFVANSFTQTQLELAGASYASAPNGLSVANQSAILLQNTSGSAFSSFNPNITITASISNQQYFNIKNKHWQSNELWRQGK
jgi:hypothetical protein